MSIRVEGVGKRFGEFVALEEVHIDVATGQLAAIL
ncbi:MAG: sulfate ABC transporter ATP-binding protein, partial [Proteobacteria bacterium]|nr:sulfate ABC transporter ATP-binding protein [Pseudomonadota bacterium]